MLVSLPAAALATALGTTLGLIAGYYGNTRLRFPCAYWLAAVLLAGSLFLFRLPQAGIARVWYPLLLGGTALLLGKQLQRFSLFRRPLAFPVDQLVLAAVTLLAAIPRLLLVLAIAAAFEPTIPGLVLLLALTSWTQSARLTRAEVRRLLELPYLEAAHSIGLPAWRIIRHHLLPNAWRPIATTFPLSIAVFIALETTLSFLGIGLPPETPSWGKLLALSRLSPSSWWLLLFPGICLLATTLSLRKLLTLGKIKSTF
ncbi:ABC transporter permease [Hymenobacter sp. BT186]|uniref:ABC transporter permease n=1 Tax=Hymenobacter telluris TaxID=2816474 RepID=A0A939EZX2_9BACT|nr:ABC transporter permease [Hymenobacter telluris]